MISIIVLLFSWFVLAASSNVCEPLLYKADWLVLDCQSRTFTEVKNISTSEHIARQVMEIDLSRNAIRQVEAGAFRRFPNTHKLDLSRNSLSSLHEDAFVGLIRLVELNVGFNEFLLFEHESYTPGLFRNTPSLEKVILSGSSVSVSTSGWPIQALSEVKHLSTLMITGAEQDVFPIPRSINELTSLRSLEFLKANISYLSRWHIGNLVNSSIDTMSFRGGVREMASDTFNDLPNLKTMNFACNSGLELSRAFDVLSSSTNHGVDSLALDMTYAGNQLFGSVDAFHRCRSILSRLRRLTVRGCELPGFHSTVHKCFSNLEILAIGFNTPYRTDDLPTSLKEAINRIPPKQTLIDFQYGLVPSYAQQAITIGCAEDSDAFYQDTEMTFPHYPSLTNISIPGFSLAPLTVDEVPETLNPWDGTNLYQADAHGCWHVFAPTTVRVVFLQHVVFQQREEIACMKIHDMNIRFVNLSSCYNSVKRLIGPVSGLDAVEVLDMSYSILEALPRGSIRSLHSMTHLNLSQNNLGTGGFDLDLSVAPNLLELDLSLNGIRSFNWTIFSGATELECLRLGNNKLTMITLEISHLRKLKNLDLQWNQISWLHNSLTAALDHHGQLTGARLDLDLRGNELSCQCGALDFTEWVQNSEYVNIIGKKALRCVNPDGIMVSLVDADVALYRKQCTLSPLSLILTAVLAPIAVAAGAIILVILGYRFRWNIKWEYHKRKRRIRKPSHPTGMAMKVGGYDAYVAYASNDERTRRWVCGTLREELEVTRPFSLYLEDRNNIPGGATATDIVEALDHSRCSLWILNDAFLKNDWCDYALHMSLVCHGRDRICIVLMPEVGQATTMPRYLEKILHPRSEYRRVEQTLSAAGEDLMWATLNDYLLQQRHLPQHIPYTHLADSTQTDRV